MRRLFCRYADGNDYLQSEAIAGTKVTVTGLEPYKDYEFRVMATSAVGRGKASTPKEVQTDEASQCRSKFCFLCAGTILHCSDDRIIDLEPDSAPMKVKARAITSKSIVVDWEPPERPNGEITVAVREFESDFGGKLLRWSSPSGCRSTDCSTR